MAEEQVDQITKIPDVKEKSVEREKDPKRVKAERKLAENNKKAREALKREMNRGIEAHETVSEESSWIPERSFDRVLTMIGLGLSLWSLFGRTKPLSKNPPENDHIRNKIPPATPASTTRPLMGMD